MDYKLTTYSEEETIELAQNIESEKFPNMIICLDGELGSGKTVFVKGFANSMGIDENITSPTFNILKCYNGEKYDFYHIDAYRLADNDVDIGLDEYIGYETGITVIEWPQFIEKLLPEELIKISIFNVNENERNIIIETNLDINLEEIK
mgnify:CR=1 FL=1